MTDERSIARSAARVGLGAVLVWAVVAVVVALLQRQLIYLPDASAPEPEPDVEDVTYLTDDGLTLTAWFLTAAGSSGPGAASSEPVSTVLVAPGNAGNRALRLPLARGLVARGHAVLLVDYRGYGGNPGRPSQTRLVADLRAARAALLQRGDVDAGRIAYLGESLGTGVVAGLAAADPPVAVVLRSPFGELADVARTALPLLPVRTLLRDRYPVTGPLSTVEAPVLVVAGDRDAIVPTRLSREVATTLGATYLEIAGAGHNDRALLDGAAYLDAVDAHLRAAVEAAGPAGGPG